MDRDENLFSKKNELIRLETFDKLDSSLEAPLRSFFRRIGLPHVFAEHVVPVMLEGSALAIMAVKDRAWPPWGVGAQTVHAFSIASPIAGESAGLSNIFLLEEDVGNVGLVAAIYAEMLGALTRRGVKEVSYIVIDGSVLAARVLTGLGFKKTEELYLSHGSQYAVHVSPIQEHLDAMAMTNAASPEFMDGNLSDQVFASTVQLMAATSIGSLPFWSERAVTPELLPNTGGFSHASRPGGVPIRRAQEE